MFYFFLAAVLLAITYRDYSNHETDTIFLLDWWLWFDVSREGTPMLFWACIGAQLVAVLGFIVCGFNSF